MRICLFFLLILSCNSLFAQQVRDEPQVLPPAQVLGPGPQIIFTAPRLQGFTGNAVQVAMPWGQSPNSELIDFLTQKNMQNQIDLSGEQEKTLNNLLKKLSSEYEKISNRFPELKRKDLPTNERHRLNRTVHLEYQKAKKQLSKELEETLVPQQVSLLKKMRFNQSIRMFGLFGTLSNGPYSDELDISDQQKKDLAKIKQETDAAIQKKIAELQKEGKEKMLRTLNSRQRKAIEELEDKKETVRRPRF